MGAASSGEGRHAVAGSASTAACGAATRSEDATLDAVAVIVGRARRSARRIDSALSAARTHARPATSPLRDGRRTRAIEPESGPSTVRPRLHTVSLGPGSTAPPIGKDGTHVAKLGGRAATIQESASGSPDHQLLLDLRVSGTVSSEMAKLLAPVTVPLTPVATTRSRPVRPTPGQGDRAVGGHVDGGRTRCRTPASLRVTW